jgi:hypothetical protein
MKIVLITYLYDIKDENRFTEIKRVITANMKNQFITETVIFFENYSEVSKDKYSFLKDVLIIDTGNTRQNYKQLFDYGNKFYKDYYVIISNTDILLDNTIGRISEINFNSKKCIALTRWNPDEINKSFHKLELQYNKNVAWSFDTYIFKSPLDCDVNTLDIDVGIGGCDTLLVKRLGYENLIYVFNPCLDIRTFHIDSASRERKNLYTYFGVDDYPWEYNRDKNNNKPHMIDIHNGLETTFINGNINVNAYFLVLNINLFF